MWCEQQLCERVAVNDVCSVLCQAHLYEAKQLEESCLAFIRENFEAVVVTPSFGSLSEEWPEVMLKITLCRAGISESSTVAALDAQRQARQRNGEKRKREE